MTTLTLHLSDLAIWDLDRDRALWVHSERAGMLRVPEDWIPFLYEQIGEPAEIKDQQRETERIARWLDSAESD